MQDKIIFVYIRFKNENSWNDMFLNIDGSNFIKKIKEVIYEINKQPLIEMVIKKHGISDEEWEMEYAPDEVFKMYDDSWKKFA